MGQTHLLELHHDDEFGQIVVVKDLDGIPELVVKVPLGGLGSDPVLNYFERLMLQGNDELELWIAELYARSGLSDDDALENASRAVWNMEEVRILNSARIYLAYNAEEEEEEQI